jgi:hypothetical protein
MEKFSAFLLKKIILRCIDQAFKNNEGDQIDNSQGYGVRKTFTLLLGQEYKSVLITLQNLYPDVSKEIFEIFYRFFKGYNYSIVKYNHCGIITNQVNCLWS